MYQKEYKSPIGLLYVLEEDNKIVGINYEKKEKNAIKKDTNLLRKAVQEMQEYFEGKRKEFDLPLNPKGTEFMKKVWEQLLKIPYGETNTYGEIAKNIGKPKAARTVGMANHNNPIPIIIPCHRVIGKNNKMVGYALGIDKKEYLLDLELKHTKERKND